MAPVRNTPGGTTTRPPPSSLHRVIAFSIASVFFVTPSPLAPYAVMIWSFSLKVGATICFLRFSISASGCSADTQRFSCPWLAKHIQWSNKEIVNLFIIAPVGYQSIKSIREDSEDKSRRRSVVAPRRRREEALVPTGYLVRQELE